MPPVIDDTETLEHAAIYGTTHARAVALPRRRERSPLLAGIGRLCTALWRRRSQEPQGVSGIQQFELPLDILARKHPDLYLQAMIGSG